MKTNKFFVIIGVLIFAQLSIFAQETSAGKKFAETFWKAISEEREYGAKSALESLKRREPNFDATKMEKALEEMMSKRANEKESSRNELRSKIEADKILTKLFQRNLQTDSGDTEGSTQKSIAEYNQLTEKILTIERSSIQRELDLALRYVKKVLEAADSNRNKLIKQLNESLDAKSSEHYYFELLLRQSYLDNAHRVFPDETDINAAYTAISNDIKSLGTVAERAAKAEKNLNAKIDAERMPKAVLHDAKLEKWFKDVFESQTAMQGKNYTFLKVNIISSDYLIKRNELTGIILSRSRGAHIAFKKADGKCYHGLYGIVQEYVGGTFTGGKLTLDFDHREMRCENVNK
ncbi:MAG TPA: hypothetical protein PKY82_20145 [Pyrinomonadaceae bacterium]|nr:hypothetical protein [Pyrinomonadaceae bacterium]